MQSPAVEYWKAFDDELVEQSSFESNSAVLAENIPEHGQHIPPSTFDFEREISRIPGITTRDDKKPDLVKISTAELLNEIEARTHASTSYTTLESPLRTASSGELSPSFAQGWEESHKPIQYDFGPDPTTQPRRAAHRGKRPLPRTSPTMSQISSRKGKSPTTKSPASEIGSTSKDRENHNNIEKKYRNSINNHYDTLLAALPAQSGAPAADGSRAKLTRSTVLDLAIGRIGLLERERDALEADQKVLEADVQHMHAEWVSLGGVILS